jgi:hypothetical protein
MNSAKLRRSRDVSEPPGSKIENCFEIGDLAAQDQVPVVECGGEESAHQTADLITKFRLTGPPADLQPPHISSGRDCTPRSLHAVTVLPFPTQAQPLKQTRRPRQPTKRISLRQARTMMDGLAFAREIGTPLNTHLIIHWGGTLVGDDPDGKLFARLRYLLDKRFRRKYGRELTAIWVRERHRDKRTRQPSEVTHSHLLLHLPSQYRKAARQDIENLVALIARQILDDRTIELTFPHNPDGKYLLKGGTPAVWSASGLPGKWRSRLGEGIIDGKRCGLTQNIGAAAQERRQLTREMREVIA